MLLHNLQLSVSLNSSMQPMSPAAAPSNLLCIIIYNIYPSSGGCHLLPLPVYPSTMPCSCRHAPLPSLISHASPPAPPSFPSIPQWVPRPLTPSAHTSRPHRPIPGRLLTGHRSHHGRTSVMECGHGRPLVSAVHRQPSRAGVDPPRVGGGGE